jgi:hypothetical protein
MAFFTNGKARITRLVLFELSCGVLIIIIGQVLGTLPSQDWLEQETIKKYCFFLGVAQVVIKGVEMFFSKTVSLFQDYEKKEEEEIAKLTKENTQ